MPSDANGVYSLPPGYLATEGETIQPSQHNPPLKDIEAALTARLSRSGAAPMTGPLRLVDGSASAPAITFNSNAGVGLYKDGESLAVTGLIKGLFPIGLGPLPWSRWSPPPGWVLCYGQTLSRSTYADLWAVAQAEIGAGSLFYNNGDGSTTFGIMDMRGRAFAGLDNMGGVAAGRLTTAFFGTAANILGQAGGSESHNLTATQIAAHVHPNTLSENPHSHGYTRASYNGGGVSGSGGASVTSDHPNTDAAYTGITLNNAANVGGQAHLNTQPTAVGSFILYAGA